VPLIVTTVPAPVAAPELSAPMKMSPLVADVAAVETLPLMVRVPVPSLSSSMSPVPVVLIAPERRTLPEVPDPIVISPPPAEVRVPEVVIAPLRVIEPEVEETVTESKPVIAPTTLIAPVAEEIIMSASLVEAVPETVIASEKVTVAAPAALTTTPSALVAPVAVTALAKVIDVPKPAVWPILILLATTVPDAKKMPVPFAIKSPKAVALDPILPVKVTVPEPALRVRSLPAVRASTLPVIVMLPLPLVLRVAAEALFDNTSPVRRRLEFDPAVTELAREIVLPAVAAVIDTPPVEEDTVLPKVTLSAIEVTLIGEELPTAPAKLIAPLVVTEPPRVTAPAPTVATDAAETAPVKPMVPVEVMETAPVVVNAPTLTLPAPAEMAREVAVIAAALMAPFTVVTEIAPTGVVPPTIPVKVTGAAPEAVVVISNAPLTVLEKVTPPVVDAFAIAPVRVTAPV